jgi:hypothetical protein
MQKDFHYYLEQAQSFHEELDDKYNKLMDKEDAKEFKNQKNDENALEKGEEFLKESLLKIDDSIVVKLKNKEIIIDIKEIQLRGDKDEKFVKIQEKLITDVMNKVAMVLYKFPKLQIRLEHFGNPERTKIKISELVEYNQYGKKYMVTLNIDKPKGTVGKYLPYVYLASDRLSMVDKAKAKLI